MAVASPDKDFFQLLRPGVILLRPPKKPAPGERVSRYALVPYTEVDFEQVRWLLRGAGWAVGWGPRERIGADTLLYCGYGRVGCYALVPYSAAVFEQLGGRLMGCCCGVVVGWLVGCTCWP